MSKFWMVNVVWYDGVSAYVSKFVVKADEDKISPESQELIDKYLSGNGEILKIELQSPMMLDDITNLKDSHEDELRAAYNRFEEFYF